MEISDTTKGDLYILGEAILWSFFPIVTILSYSGLSAINSLAWSTLFAAIFFGTILVIKGKARELLNPHIYKYLIIIAFLIGWLFYGLYFAGLKYTTAGNASIIALMELFFSYIFFNVWKKEDLSKRHTVGAVLMIVGAVIILYPKHGLSFHGGDWMILLATACPPLGNYYQQKVRKLVSSETVLFLRSLFTFPFFFLLAYILKAQAPFADVANAFWILAINGVLLLGLSKIWWLEGINLISVTKANALASITPLFTIIFAYFILRQAPTIWQFTAFIPLVAGLILLTRNSKTVSV